MVAVTSLEQPAVLMDVLEEHLDEAEFGIVQLAAAHESPILTLDDLARYPEEGLVAHVDGLVVSAETARRELLDPIIEDAASEEAARVTASALALMEAGEFHALAPALDSEEEHVLRAIGQAGALASNADVDGWIQGELARRASGPHSAALIELSAARGLQPSNLLAALQSESTAVVRAATRAALFGDLDVYLPVLVYLLEHPDLTVREAALRGSLAQGAPHGWAACERWALDGAQPSRFATCLYAALGRRSDHAQLTALLSEPAARCSVLFALGFTGNVDVVPALLSALQSQDGLEAKLAVQSLGMILGFVPYEEALTTPPERAADVDFLPRPEEDPEATRSLPPLEEDDLEADLVPAPEEELAPPDARAVQALCEARLATIEAKKRLLFGAPYAPEHVVSVLSTGPMRWREIIATAFRVRCGGPSWLRTSAWSGVQRRALSTWSAATPRRYLAW